jgi:hypothetical protein
MKYMILAYASQRDYDALTGHPAPGTRPAELDAGRLRQDGPVHGVVQQGARRLRRTSRHPRPAVAVAMVQGPAAGLALLDALEPLDYRHDVARAPSIRHQRYLLNRAEAPQLVMTAWVARAPGGCQY